MYSVFIVDDEEFVIKSLIRGTKWAENGFEVIASSNDGVDAFEEILRLKPDLVFTDIRMPGMTGLELIKSVREKLGNIHFVIISGYAEFAYAQKALNYGAIGYCLKPFDSDEIHNVLKKVKAALDSSTSIIDDIIYLIEDEDEGSQTLISGYFQKNGLEAAKGIAVAAVIGGKNSDIFNVTPSVRLKAGNEKYICFLPDELCREIECQFGSPVPANVKGIGINETIFSFTNLKKAIDEAVTLAYQYFITGSKGPFRRKEDSKGTEKLIVDFENALIRVDIESIKKSLGSIEEAAKTGKMNVKNAVNIFNSYVSFLSRMLGEESYEEYVYSLDELCKHFADIYEMLGHISSSIMNVIGGKKNLLKDDVRNEYFKKIIDCVNQNFYKDITIQSLSKDYNLNANYLCQLFKRKLGMTFTDYITELRINYSKELLENTRLTLDEIAGKSGYTDYFYFIRVFKKMTGYSPGQFRHLKQV